MNLKHLIFLTLLSISFNTFGQLVWHHTDGPEGALDAFITSTDSLAFVATDDFLFTLQKEDTIWTKTSFDGPDKWVIHNNFFAGLKSVKTDSTYSYDLMTSLDFGKSWLSVDIAPSVPSSNVIAAVDSGIFVLDVNDYYMYHTVDTGLNWDTIRLPGSYGHFLQAFDNHLYLNNDAELWVSDSTGLNWLNISPPARCRQHISVKDSIILVVGTNRICHSHDYY